jgi:hypothetical protein
VVKAVILDGERPQLPPGMSVSGELWSMMESCWSDDVTDRPTARSLVLRLESYSATEPGTMASFAKADEQKTSSYEVQPWNSELLRKIVQQNSTQLLPKAVSDSALDLTGWIEPLHYPLWFGRLGEVYRGRWVSTMTFPSDPPAVVLQVIRTTDDPQTVTSSLVLFGNQAIHLYIYSFCVV